MRIIFVRSSVNEIQNNPHQTYIISSYFEDDPTYKFDFVWLHNIYIMFQNGALAPITANNRTRFFLEVFCYYDRVWYLVKLCGDN